MLCCSWPGRGLAGVLFQVEFSRPTRVHVLAAATMAQMADRCIRQSRCPWIMDGMADAGDQTRAANSRSYQMQLQGCPLANIERYVILCPSLTSCGNLW